METKKILNNEEVQKLLSAPDNARDKLLLAVLYETGCSVNEIASLKTADFSQGKLHIAGKRERTVKISDTVSEELLKFVLGKARESPLFTGKQGELTTKRVRQIVHQYTKSALGEEINPQAMRYTSFAHSLSKGMNAAAAGKNLGLEAQRTSQLYTAYSQPILAPTYREFLRRM